jgi:cyclic dehypoxanthinyl futalosine synthase
MTRNEALDFFLSSDLIGLGIDADEARRRVHPENVVTYFLEEDGAAPLQKLPENGGICIRSGLDEELLHSLRRVCSSLTLRASASEVLSYAKRHHLDLNEALVLLSDAGLDSITDEDLPADEWLRLHRAAHGAGMKTVASYLFGAGEPLEARVDFLDTVRRIQEETGGFVALAPISYAPVRQLDAPTGVEYLKMIAIARLYLPEIEHIQASSISQGPKMVQLALRFGADDAGVVPPGITEQDLRRMIRDAGFRPVQRDLLYRMVMLG